MHSSVAVGGGVCGDCVCERVRGIACVCVCVCVAGVGGEGV